MAGRWRNPKVVVIPRSHAERCCILHDVMGMKANGRTTASNTTAAGPARIKSASASRAIEPFGRFLELKGPDAAQPVLLGPKRQR